MIGYIELEDGSYFEGTLLGESSTAAPDKTRWTEVRVFWNHDSNAYVAEVLGQTEHAHEEIHCNVYYGEDGEGIVLALEYDGNLSYPAREALEEAAEQVTSIRNALA